MSLQHAGCGGDILFYRIEGHNFCYMQCKECRLILGGERQQEKVKRLSRTKVLPRIRQFF